MRFFRKKAESKQPRALSELGVRNARTQLQLVRALKSTRERQGISVQEVAETMGVDASVVYRFEKGGTNFTMSTLRSYANAVKAELALSAFPEREGLGASVALEQRQLDAEVEREWKIFSEARVPKKREMPREEDFKNTYRV